jgi:5-methyltetrahydrofolate--homocysteine methyltransferase
MVRGVVPLLECGVEILGACCGSTPDHVRAFRQAIDRYLNERRPAAGSRKTGA